jgi:predicted dehydrogenase
MPKVAVVGCGYWGPNLVRNLVENRGCSEIVCCDLHPDNLERIATRYPAVRVTPDFEDLLHGSVDAVMIATPLSTHYTIARKALEAGLDVFVEKPFTGSSREARDLIELSRRRGLVLMVGHTFEYSPPVIKIRDLIQSGELGTIFYLSSTRVNLGLHQKDVSVVWDLAPHDLSMMIYWLGEAPASVAALGKDFVQPGIPDVAFVSMTFASGVIGHVQVSWLSPSKLRRTTIVGSQKMVVYDDTDHLERVKVFDKGVSFRDPETFGEYQLSYRTGDIVSPKLDTTEPLQAEVSDFLEAVRNRSRPRCDGENGLRVVQVLEAVERSLDRGGEVVELLPREPAAASGGRPGRL